MLSGPAFDLMLPEVPGGPLALQSQHSPGYCDGAGGGGDYGWHDCCGCWRVGRGVCSPGQ